MSSAFESFVTVHQYQLANIPKELWESLFMKLGEDYLDAGNFVELHHGDPLEGYSLHLKQSTTLKKHSEIFLIDHAWTTSPDTAKEELTNNVALMDRLENLMDIDPIEAPEDSDVEEDVEKPPAELIQLVAEQANVSESVAEAALIAENNEVINAIMTLTIDPEAKAEADRLHDQVMNQVLASGKPQEKEQEETKERLERRQAREKVWYGQRAEAIYEKMWSYLQTYTFSILQQDGQPVTQTAWYINDEVGSAISHSFEPNVVCVPFIFSRGPRMIPYSVFYPVQDIEAGELITCDLVPKTIERETDREAYLFAFEHVRVNDLDREAFIQRYQPSPSQPLQAHQPTSQEQVMEIMKKETKKEWVVYTDAPFVQQHLKGVKFTNEPKHADILWYSQDFKEWDTLSEHQLINQIPNESSITFKHNLAKLIQETYGSPAWFPTTYNVMTQLSEFVSDYLAQENLWIMKPWNMARGLGLKITNNLPELIRQRDDAVPKVVQRYLTTPCLYKGKKFDLRYIVMVSHTEPLVGLVYKMFWTRLANKKYNTEDLQDYERQFTVMNYTNYQMTELDHTSFIRNMEAEHEIKWEPIQQEIYAVIKQVLVAAKLNGKQSFGVYGFDIMLTQEFKPMVLEVNFSPDCTRVCQYDPEFVNNTFSIINGSLQGLNAFTIL